MSNVRRAFSAVRRNGGERKAVHVHRAKIKHDRNEAGYREIAAGREPSETIGGEGNGPDKVMMEARLLRPNSRIALYHAIDA
jgi:hypothetical protein